MLKTPDGVALRFARWAPPPGRKGTVCLFPGRAEFIEKYFETVRDLRARGFAVATIDWRGQGALASARCAIRARAMCAASPSTTSISTTFVQRGRAAGLPAAGVRARAFDGRDRADARRLSGAALVRPHGAARRR